MRSLVVLSALFAVSVAAPHYAFETSAVYGVPTVYAAPAAVSHQSRVDVHNSPAVIAAEPVVEPVNVVVSTPAVVAPVQTVVAAPAAVSHQSRVDVHTSSPKFVAAGPVIVAKTYEPANNVVVNPTFVSVPSAYVAPAATVYSGGAAVSHQSRVDVKSSPAVITEQVVEPAYVSSVVEAVPTVFDTASAVVDARSVYVAPSAFYSAGFIKK